MIPLRKTEDGIEVPIHAQPGARRNEIVGVHDNRLKVAVTQVAEKGKANRAILKLLAKELNFSKSQLSIVAGATSSRKTLQISNVTREDVQSVIAPYLDATT